MATQVAGAGDFIRPYRGPVRLRTFPEGASQSFKKGYLLKFGADAGAENRVIVVAADPTLVVGVAAQDASGTTDNPVSVWLAEAGVEFRVRYADSQAIDQTDIADAGFGMVADGTNLIHRLDNTETSAKVFHVTELLDADGDVNGAVAATILAAVRAPFAE